MNGARIIIDYSFYPITIFNSQRIDVNLIPFRGYFRERDINDTPKLL